MNPFTRSFLIFLALSLLIPAWGRAQTCTGSLGDPVINLDFGSGNDAPIPLAPGLTSYNFTPTACPDNGQYTLVNNSSGCFNNTWHTLSEDHTPGDTKGNMMLVNASAQGGDFYTRRLTGLCENTTYEFAAWILNILKTSSCNGNGIDPNVTFSIETVGGTVLKTYSTGGIAETTQAEWKQYGFFFTTPAGNPEIILRMTNSAVGSCGNDLALDDITFRPCGPLVSAAVSTGPAGTTNKLCEGESATVYLNGSISSGYTNPSFQWQVNNNDGTGWQDLTAGKASSVVVVIPSISKNDYQFRLAVAEGQNVNSVSCRVLSQALTVSVEPKPIVNAGKDLEIREGEQVKLAGSITGNNTRYYWTPSTYLDDPNSLSPIASPTEDIVYTLHAERDGTCVSEATDQVFIRVLKDIVIPNAFSPNGDNVNDYWKIKDLDSYPSAEVKVFSRYGQIVFKSTGYREEWDGTMEGKPLAAGVYYYMVDLKKDGQRLSGSLLIIR